MLFKNAQKNLSSNRTVSTNDIGLSVNEGLESSIVEMVDKIDDTGVHDILFLTMPNVGNACSLSSAIHLAGLRSDIAKCYYWIQLMISTDMLTQVI